MSFVFPTNASQVQAFAGALYGVQVGSATMAQVNADILANGGLAATLNGYYSATIAKTADAATAVATNLGLTGAALTEGTAYITAQLNAAAPNARGAVISNIVNLFGTYTADATFGAAATAWNTKIATAVAYTGATNVAVGTANAPVVVTPGIFALGTGPDTPASTGGNDTYTGVINGAAGTATFSIGDSIDGGGGTDTLVLNDLANANPLVLAVPVGAKLTSIEALTVNGAAAVTSDTSVPGFAGVSTVNVNALTNAVVTAATGQAVNVTTSASPAAGTTSINGGTGITANVTGEALANAGVGTAVTLGATTALAGAVNLTVANTSSAAANNDAAAGGVIGVTGGSAVTVNQTIAPTAAAATAIKAGNITATYTQGATTVTGSAATTAVTINQSAAKAAVTTVGSGAAAIVAGATNVLDANRTSTTTAGTITTVTLNNSGAATVNSGALKELNLTGTLTTVDAGLLGALTTPANTALAVNLNGAVSTGALTIDTDITTINLSGAGTTASTIASLVDASATAVNVAGSARVTITAQTLAAAAVITSTNTVGTTLTAQLGINQQFVGGAGADSVSVAATTKAITMGDGNDVVTISTETLGAGGSINGGAGVNTIVADTNTSALNGNSNITGFTTLRVAGGAAQGAHNATGFTALEAGALAGPMSFTNVAAGTTLKYLANAGQTSAYQLANSGGTSDVLNVTISSAGAVNANTLTAAGIETVNITTTDTDTTAHQNTLALAATSATGITVTGNAGLAYTNTGNIKVATFNASGVTGAATAATSLGVTFTSVTTTANSATMTITGGSGNDTLTGGNTALTNTADTINGGAGNDTIDGGTGADVIDGGEGTNTLLTAGMIGTNIEGLNSGTSTGVVVNLGTTAVSATTINTAMGGTIGTAALLTSVAAGRTALVYATQDALFSQVQDTLVNIQNVTGTGGADYIVGTAVANTIIGGVGADIITTGAGADIVELAAIAVAGNVAGADVITDFSASSNDVIRVTDAAYTWFNGTSDGVVVLATGTTLDAAHIANANFTVATISTNVVTHTVATYLAGTSTIAELEGTIATALGAATNANFAATDNILVAVDDGASTMLVRVVSANNGDAIADAELSLVGILRGVTDATTLAAGNFVFA